MPNHARFTGPWYNLVSIICAWFLYAARLLTRGSNDCRSYCFAYRMKLVIARDLLDNFIAIGFKQYKVANVIQKQFRIKKAFYQGFQKIFVMWLVMFVAHYTPR